MSKNKIKRGVSLYSYQQEYYLRQMNLEDCIKAVADMGADGIEIISEAMIENFPNPSDEWIAQWFALLKKYNCIPTCYDAFMDGRIRGEEMISDDEAVQQMERDIKLAKKMGFATIRVLCAVPLRIIERALPLAEKLDIKLGIEVHSPFKLATPWLEEYIDFIKRTGTKHFGIIPDFGIFVKRPVRILVRKHIRAGATPAIVEYICECYENSVDFDKMMANVNTMNPNAEDLFWADEAYHYTYCDPQLLAQYVPYIIHIHGKMYEMTLENGEWDEYSIPNEKIIKVLQDSGWEGYINTEYEGQRHYHDMADFDINSVEQVKHHHEMLARYLGEA